MKVEQTRDALEAVLARMAARRSAKLPELGFEPAPWSADKCAHAIRHP